MRFHFIPVRNAKLKKNLTLSNVSKTVKKLEFSYCWWECKVGTITLGNSWQFLKLKITILFNHSTLGICPEEMKAYVYSKTYT